MASTPEKKKTITLRTMPDNQEFVVEESVAIQSVMIQNMIDTDECYSVDVIPVPQVTGEIFSLVIEYSKAHADKSASEADLKSFDSKFIDKFELETLFKLILAADFLENKGLFQITAQKTADRIQDKPHQEVREIFNVTNDFTPEEEAAIRTEHEWAFEGFT